MGSLSRDQLRWLLSLDLSYPVRNVRRYVPSRLSRPRGRRGTRRPALTEGQRQALKRGEAAP